LKFADFIPEIFLRIEFRRIGRKIQERDVIGNGKVAAAVIGRAVDGERAMTDTNPTKELSTVLTIPPVAAPFNLTPRQADVFRLISLSNKGIARALHLGEGTVKIHLKALYVKTGMSRRDLIASKGPSAADPRRHWQRMALAVAAIPVERIAGWSPLN
jgi:DNA-binding NarL/FixJ family response regulator